MSLAVVGHSAQVGISGTTIVIPYSPTPGNALVVFFGQSSSATRTWTVSDNIDGVAGWVFVVLNNPARAAGLWCKANVPAGVTTITITETGTAPAAQGVVLEVSGAGTTLTVDAADSLSEGVAGGTHACSALGLTSTNPVIAVCSGVLVGTGSECTPGPGYSEIPTGQVNPAVLMQYQLFPAGCAAEVGAWQNSGTGRIGVSCMALLSGGSAPSAVVSGTAIEGGVTESELAAGGQTIVITLTGDTFIPG